MQLEAWDSTAKVTLDQQLLKRINSLFVTSRRFAEKRSAVQAAVA